MASQRVEKLLIASNWQPRPGRAVDTRLTLFEEIDGWREAWQAAHRLDENKLQKLVQGELDLFSYEALFVGAPVDWRATRLLGAHVGSGAHDRPGCRRRCDRWRFHRVAGVTLCGLGQPEIQHLHPTVWGHDDIGRL